MAISVGGVIGLCDENFDESGDLVVSGTGAAAEDDVATNDVIRVDVDAIHSGTAAKGLIVTLGFALP